MKKVISLMLSLVMLMSITAGLNLTAYAETVEGSCGEDANYSFDTETGVLTIDGTGDMNDYRSIPSPWYMYATTIYSIIIEHDITNIGIGAFADCGSLESITIPSTVISIGIGAFDNCSSLESIAIPSSVTNIGEYAFYGCKGLTSISVDSNNTVYDSRDNCNALIETATNTLVKGCKNTVIPNTVTIIGDGAFYKCSNLESVSIPNGVTSIGNSAFDGCSGLKSITVDSNNTVYDSRDNCNALIETSTNILFIGCQNTVIPNTVTTIGDGAFYKCSSLDSIIIPSSVISICEYAFDKCNNLTDVYYTGTEDNWNQIDIEDYNDALTNATLHFNHIHSYSDVVTMATCTENGYAVHTCTECGYTYNESLPATGHNFGSNSPTCLTCGVANPNYVAPAPAVTQPAISQTATTQTVTTATTVKKPKATSIKKLTKAKKSFKVTYKKISGVTGYQVTYSTSKKFTKKTTTTVTIKGAKNTSKTIKKLKAKKKYYVKVRTYKTVKVNGKSKKVYSSWSKTKTVTTK